MSKQYFPEYVGWGTGMSLKEGSSFKALGGGEPEEEA